MRIDELNTLRECIQRDMSIRYGEQRGARREILVCAGGACISSGSESIRDALNKAIEEHECADENRVVEVGCVGSCDLGPVVMVHPEGTFYQRVRPEDAPRIVKEHLIGGRVVEDLLFWNEERGELARTVEEIPFLSRQVRIVLRNAGIIDPRSIEEYIARDGYQALAKVLTEMSPEEVVEEVRRSALRGRGGAGFPTGLKWAFTQKAQGSEKFVVCNADEGDPGAFMDRSVLEGDPHSVIEGMAIAGYAVGADQGYVYVRAEYPLAIERLKRGIEQARKFGLLGERIFGTWFDFDIEIRIGAGAFVCGEETALIASIEGRRGMPRPRPPFPASKGLWGKPTLVNNVETYANINPIILKSGEAFARIGTEQSKGTKVFALAGDIRNTGLVEVPMGIPLGEIIYDIGGGIRENKAFKAAQMGGPSGGCIPREYLNVPVDYESLKELGAIMGSGGLIVMSEDTCMVSLARFFMEFLADESCGKCVPCRVGTTQLLGILTRITEGKGEEEDIDRLLNLGRMVKQTSLCGLGQTAPNAVLSTIRYFREEYEAHIRRKECPAGVCPDLVLAPCENACPAHVDAPGYIALIGEGRYAEALALHRQKNPFPSVCGRVCTHPCEGVCRRRDTDEAIAIRQLKRFMADYERLHPPKPVDFSPSAPTKDKVAIVGAGPAGLTAAYFLAPLGYAVTVFEAHSEPGGALLSIPDYRMPKDIVRQEVEMIQSRGVEIRTNERLGADFSIRDLFDKGYKAVFLAVGTYRSARLEIPGETLDGVMQGLDFVWDVNAALASRTGQTADLRGKTVAVIGGGNVAIDAARSAIRLGAKVHIIYRRRRSDMPAEEAEIREAEREGVQLHYLLAPVEVLGNGRVEQLCCVHMNLGEFDRSGRRRPIPSGEEETFEVDQVIAAIGQAPDLSFIQDGEIQLDRRGQIMVNPDTCMTRWEGVFAGGDVVTGPGTVVQAIAAGQKAAMATDRYLGGPGVIWPEEREVVQTSYDEEAYAGERKRESPPEREVEERRGNFNEVELCFSIEQAVEEAKRCLHCDRRA